jgi:hypothetical protein
LATGLSTAGIMAGGDGPARVAVRCVTAPEAHRTAPAAQQTWPTCLAGCYAGSAPATQCQGRAVPLGTFDGWVGPPCKG